jgi:hypothetical protein
MVWMVEKMVIHHVLDMGFETVKIPIRVKFEFEVKEGSFVPGSIFIQTLYNKQSLERRYPKLKLESLETAMDRTVKREIREYLKAHGYISE